MEIKLTGEELTRIIRNHIGATWSIWNPMKVFITGESLPKSAKYFSVTIEVQETPQDSPSRIRTDEYGRPANPSGGVLNCVASDQRTT